MIEKHPGLQPALGFKWKRFTTSFPQGLCPWIEQPWGHFEVVESAPDSEPESCIPDLALSLLAGVAPPFWARVEVDWVMLGVSFRSRPLSDSCFFQTKMQKENNCDMTQTAEQPNSVTWL